MRLAKRIALVCALLAFGQPALAQVTPGTSPLSIAKGGTAGATAPAARTNLGLGTIATQNANSVAITGGSITGMPAPTNPSDVATKNYADGLANGLRVLAASRLATAAVLPNTPTYANGASGVGATLTAGANSTLTVDGTVANLNDVVLVQNQASAFQNGIYTVTTAGSGAAAWVLTRATYFDQAAEMLAGSYTAITAGAANANRSFVLASTVTTVGTTAATFNLFSNAGVTTFNGATGAVTGVTSVTCGSGLTGGAITNSGTCAIQGVISPLAFGAACDGVTHDEVAFQNALNAAIAAGVMLQLPIGNCVLNANITNGTSSFISTQIQGYGNNSTLTFLGNFGFSLNATASYYFFQNFQVVCQSTSTSACIKIFSATQSTSDNSLFQNVMINGCGTYGWYFQNMAQAKFINNTIVNTGTGATAGLYMDNSQTPDTGGNLIRGNYITTSGGSTSVGIYMVNNGGVVVDNNHVGNAGGYATDVFWLGASPATGSSGLTITGNMLDNCTSSCIQLNSATQTLFHLVIANNLIHMNANTVTGIFLNWATTSLTAWLFNVSISGNTIDTPVGLTGINIYGTTGLSVIGNSIISTGGTSTNGAITLQSANGGVTHCTAVGNSNFQFAATITNTAGCVVAGNTSP